MSKFAIIVLTFAVLALAACGAVATPIWQEPPTATPTIEPTIAPTRQVVPSQSQTTEIAPTATTEEIIEFTVTSSPTAEPPTPAEVQPTATAETSSANTQPTAAGTRDPLTVLISLSDAEHGQELFNTFFDEAGYMCATCHRVDTTEKLLGPGLLGISGRGGSAAGHEGHTTSSEAPERYIYNSITNPDLHVVEGFPDSLMPEVYAEIFSDQDIYDIIAYLMTLE